MNRTFLLKVQQWKNHGVHYPPNTERIVGVLENVVLLYSEISPQSNDKTLSLDNLAEFSLFSQMSLMLEGEELCATIYTVNLANK